MPRRRKSTDTLPFDTLRLEGSLFVPELLERASRGEATAQKEADYAIPKGLKLHDEYGRAFRIATALWQDFAAQLPRRDLDPAATTRAFASDLLRQCLGYTDLTLLAEPFALGDRAFPVTALASGGSLPVIIAPHTLGLDDPDPQFAILGSGAKKKSAHQLAQEFLNASRDHLWAIVTNGKSLRLLRDAETLTRPNFLEIDLETILRESEDRYADFSALWRILHASRAPSSHCSPITDHSALGPIWETWKSEGHAQGLRVRDGLRNGVQAALLTLGTGFLNHPENTALRARLAEGTLTKDAYFQQLLRLVYRFLFLFCAEERDLLHPPENQKSTTQNPQSSIDPQKARAAYARGYALRRFRTRSLRRTAHDRHGDLWVSVQIVHRALATGQEQLALPALGGLFAADQCPDLDTAALANHDLLAAMRHLRWANIGGRLTAIDYRNMGPEELGSVYESLLELIPTIDLPARRFGFAGITDDGSTAGNTRKTTGSYYTPDSLVQELIKSALDPVIAQKIADHPEDPIAALLSLSVCDPSCGSGHFLLAAGRRLAEKLAELRSADGAVRPEDYRHALREVASRCLYGVDINPMAVELCRVALWLETVDPGKPLGFLDHHIRHGNSLLGTTPGLIAAGLPDNTFKAIEGDDKKACAELKKRNKKEREGFGPLFADEENQIREKLRIAATAIEGMDDSRPDLLAHKATAFATAESSPEHQHAKLLADLWCAAFVIKKRFPSSSPISNLESQITDSSSSQSPIPQADLFGQPIPASKPTAKPKKPPLTDHRSLGTAHGITTGTLRDFVQGKPLPEDLESEVTQLAEQYRFFHWHLAFPQVFDKGGFHCILGNPPWEQVEQQDANQHNEVVTGAQHFVESSGRYPLTGNGRKNLYALFAELVTSSLSPSGCIGLVLPTALLQDSPASNLASKLLEAHRLCSVFDFENRRKGQDGEKWFLGVHPQQRFCLLTVATGVPKAKLVFDVAALSDLEDPDRYYFQTLSEIKSFCETQFKVPMFKRAIEAGIASAAYMHGTMMVFQMQGPNANLRSGLVFNAEPQIKSRKISVQEVKDQADLVRVYEGTYIHQFDHRFATMSGSEETYLTGADKKSAETLSITKTYIPRQLVVDRLNALAGYIPGWFVALRRQARATDAFISISSIVPFSAAEGNLSAFFFKKRKAAMSALLCATFNSYIFNFLTRLRQSGANLNKNVYSQIPIIDDTLPVGLSSVFGWRLLTDWLLPRVLELTYTAWDLEAFAADCGWPGPPFRWDEDRRFLLRCELDAAFFHLYLGSEDEWCQQPEALTRAFPTPRDAVSYIMDTFPIVKRKDEAKHNGQYRTKETILQIYDALTESIATGIAYETMLDPCPTSFRAMHSPRMPDSARNTQDPEDVWLHFTIHFIRLARSEATLPLLREAWHRFADLSRYHTELSTILPEEQFNAWERSNPVKHTRSGFHQFVSNLVGSHQLSYDESSQVLSFSDKTLDDIAGEPWLQTEVSLSLQLLAQHPDVEKWLPKATAQRPIQRDAAMREFLTAAS